MTPAMRKAAIRENASVEVITGTPPVEEFLAREVYSQGVLPKEGTMGIIWTIIIGFVAGWLRNFSIPEETTSLRGLS
jgi:hypothetical protein